MTEQEKKKWLKIGAGVVALVLVLKISSDWRTEKERTEICSAMKLKLFDTLMARRLMLEGCETAKIVTIPNRDYPNINELAVTVYAQTPPGTPWRRVGFTARVSYVPPFGWSAFELHEVPAN